ncbi:hypothetical protein FACS1894106_5620 [Spirochaetia bacterium]|nr:hypothetical protein FACS1894106_5620 [Spirochaetia bacterium]
MGIDVTEKGDISHVKAVFQRIFREYGMPEYIRSDNGPPFASSASVWGLTKLAVWWMTVTTPDARIRTAGMRGCTGT